MLKRDEMAMKFAKLKVLDVIKDVKDNRLKTAVIDALEVAYVSGYDLAKEECRKENSRSGEDMYHYLNELEANQTGVI